MKFLKLLDFRNTKYAFIILAMIANITWVIVFIDVIIARWMTQGGWASGMDVAMILGVFLGSAVIGFIVTLIAADGHGPTYGIYGGLAGLVTVVVLVFMSSAMLAALVGLTAVLGGFNGGMLGEGMRFSRNKKKQ